MATTNASMGPSDNKCNSAKFNKADPQEFDFLKFSILYV